MGSVKKEEWTTISFWLGAELICFSIFNNKRDKTALSKLQLLTKGGKDQSHFDIVFKDTHSNAQHLRDQLRVTRTSKRIHVPCQQTPASPRTW